MLGSVQIVINANIQYLCHCTRLNNFTCIRKQRFLYTQNCCLQLVFADSEEIVHIIRPSEQLDKVLVVGYYNQLKVTLLVATFYDPTKY